MLKKEVAIVTTPGNWLSSEANGVNPGEGYIRLALVPTIKDCKIADSERFYVEINVFDEDGEKITKGSIGDSGALWIKDLFGKATTAGNNLIGKSTDNLVKYDPGYYIANYSVLILEDGKEYASRMEMEVLVNYGDE